MCKLWNFNVLLFHSINFEEKIRNTCFFLSQLILSITFIEKETYHEIILLIRS